MAKPRKTYVLKTEHFDILFSNVSSDTAKYLADNIDALYEQAKSELTGANDLRIPVIISPDSDRLSVDYTCTPYNRIVIFDGVPDRNSFSFRNSLLGLFYHEIYLALSQTIMNPINQFIFDTVGGDCYHPISLVYMPFSFVEGRAFLAEGKEFSHSITSGEDMADIEENSPNFYGRFSDRYFLNILSIAKYENRFPNWLQVSAVRDIYPGRLLNEAAGSAFSAYLIQTYGIDKYIEFWNACGGINFALTSGMFKKVYNKSLNVLWNDFKECIPMPPGLENIALLEKETSKVFEGDVEGLCNNLVLSEYGLVWYDGIRHEVDILDLNNNKEMWELLFLAGNVKKLTLSPDGRYLIVSFYGVAKRKEFRDDKVWIYDLSEREFLDYDFNLRDGVVVRLESGKDVFAGIDVKDKVPKLQIYDFEYDDNQSDFILEKEFYEEEHIDSLTYAGNGRVSYIIGKNNKRNLCQYNIDTREEKAWTFFYKGKSVNINELRILKTARDRAKNRNIYTFEFFDPVTPSFLRMGIVLLNENYEPEKVYFQSMDLAGGITYPIILNNSFYFCSQKFTHNELQYIPIDKIQFEQGTIEVNEISKRKIIRPVKVHKNKLKDYKVSEYNPFGYMTNCSVIPFMAIKDLATIKEQKLWPSLGATVVTQYDPFMNSRIMFSGSGGYAKLDYKTTLNPTSDDINDKKQINVDDNKNVSFGISIENTSTPVDIRAGCLFKFNKDGEYNFTINGNAFWQVPLGMAFSKFNFGVIGNYTASTDYYDRNLSSKYPDLNNWPDFPEAYEVGNIAFGMEYTNIHQYGLSKYEERGISFGIKLYSFWDITEIRTLNKKYDEMQDSISNDSLSGLTQAQISKFYSYSLLNMSQLNIGFLGTIKIPNILPFSSGNGFIYSLPTTFDIEVLNTPGNAFDALVETLLFGYECQNGFPFMYLFFSRLGLKFGYNLKLNYDTSKVPLPDIRAKNGLWNIFSNSYVRDSIYLLYNMDFCEAIGRLSEYQIHLSMKAEYFIRSKGFTFSFKFLVSF